MNGELEFTDCETSKINTFAIPMANFLLEYFRKHKTLIAENLDLCRDPNDIEAIHNFRLSTKRIRVVARLADKVSEGRFNSREKLREINFLFKRAGRLRDIQVIQQLLQNYRDPAVKPVMQEIRKKEGRRRKKFEAAYSEYPQSGLDLFEQRLIELMKDTSLTKLRGAAGMLMAEHEDEIRRLFHGSAEEKRLHRIRTRLKSINYLNNAFGEQLPVEEHLHIPVERLREVGELAGSWHDCLILEKTLGKHLMNDPESSPSLKTVLDKIILQKEELAQEYRCVLMNEMKI